MVDVRGNGRAVLDKREDVAKPYPLRTMGAPRRRGYKVERTKSPRSSGRHAVKIQITPEREARAAAKRSIMSALDKLISARRDDPQEALARQKAQSHQAAVTRRR